VSARFRLFDAAVCLILLCARGICGPGEFRTALPDCLGLNIHFLEPKAGEMEMLAASGAHWARMDFMWEATEKAPGRYDFTAYDRLVSVLESYKIRPYFILDYANPHYDNGMSPYTEEGRQAFAQWAAAAVEHFQGRGILWEIYNEPNIGFWRPKPHAHDYILLALQVGEAIRSVSAQEVYVGPAVSLIDLEFLEACFKAGMLNYWSAVSVHPYRQRDPESAGEEFRRLRRLIAAYAGEGREVPIIAGEWGYSSAWNWEGMDEAKQGKLLAREFLSNLAGGIPLTIWYDWHDDSAAAKDPESHFGTVYFPYQPGAKPVYRPKPAYLALKTLSGILSGYQFSKRLEVGGAGDYVLLFRKEQDVRLAAWTTSSTARKVAIPSAPGRVMLTGHLGQKLKPLASHQGRLAITLTDAPVYLVPEYANQNLQ